MLSELGGHNASYPHRTTRATIQHTEGLLLVIAGPGAGQTLTLVERILYLVTDKGVRFDQTLVHINEIYWLRIFFLYGPHQ